MNEISEEFVTKSIMKYLQEEKYEIISFDFPQSGTGHVLHPNSHDNKNYGAIIPDIIAKKSYICIIMENKDRYIASDFEKLTMLRDGNKYSQGLIKLKEKIKVKSYFFGAGIPFVKEEIAKALNNCDKIDFLIAVGNDEKCSLLYGNIDI